MVPVDVGGGKQLWYLCMLVGVNSCGTSTCYQLVLQLRWQPHCTLDVATLASKAPPRVHEYIYIYSVVASLIHPPIMIHYLRRTGIYFGMES